MDYWSSGEKLSREQSWGGGIIIAHSQNLSEGAISPVLWCWRKLSALLIYLWKVFWFFLKNWSALSKASPWHFCLPRVWRRYLKTDCEKLKPWFGNLLELSWHEVTCGWCGSGAFVLLLKDQKESFNPFPTCILLCQVFCKKRLSEVGQRATYASV